MSLFGPQSDRLRTWAGDQRKGGNARNELIIEREYEKDFFEREIEILRRENENLKDQNQRTLKQLKSYHINFPSSSNFEDNFVDIEDMPAWTSSSEIVNPLFVAYDLRIKELEDTISKQNYNYSSLQDMVGGIVSENEALKSELLENISGSKFQRASNMPSSSSSASSELVSELNERIDVLMAENAVLVEHKSALSSELENYHEELNKLAEENSKYSKQISLLGKEVQSLKASMLQLENDRNEAGLHAMKFSEAFSKADSQLELLREQHSQARDKISEQDLLIEDLKKALKSVEANANAEAHSLVKKMKVLEDRMKELQNALGKKTFELDESLEVSRKVRREYASTRQDAEGMLQVMGGLEKQVLQYAAREADLEKLMKEYRDKMEESLTSRDQALCKEEFYRKEVARLQEERKSLAQKYQVHLEEAIESIEAKANNRTGTFQTDAKNLASIVADLRISSDKAIRESASSKNHYERLLKQNEDDRLAYEERIRGLHDKNIELIAKSNEEIRRRMEFQEINKDLRSQIDKLRNQIESLKMDSFNLEKRQMNELDKMKFHCVELERELLVRTKELGELQRKDEEGEATREAASKVVEKAHLDETQALRQSLAEARASLEALEASCTLYESRAAFAVEHLKEKSSQRIAHLERVMKDEVSKYNSLYSRSRDLELSLQETEREVQSYAAVLDEAKRTILQLQEDLKVTQMMLAEFTSSSDNKSFRDKSIADSYRDIDDGRGVERGNYEDDGGTEEF